MNPGWIYANNYPQPYQPGETIPQIQNNDFQSYLSQHLFTEEFFRVAFDVYHTYSRNYQKTKKKLEKQFPLLHMVNLDTFKTQCQEPFSVLRAEFSQISSNDLDDSGNGLITNSSLYRNPSPGVQPRKGPWSQTEIDKLLTAVSSKKYQTPNGIQWGWLSQNIPGRCGQQCYLKYHRLSLSDGLPPEPISEFDQTTGNESEL